MANYVQNFSGDISIDGGIDLDGGITANLSANETAYEYQKGLNVSLANEGTYYFVGCGGNVTIENANAIVYLMASPFVTINNAVGAKTYRDGHAVGGILSTTSEVSPIETYGGNWEKLTADAYLKIVDSNGGMYNGTNADTGVDYGFEKTARTTSINVQHQNNLARHNHGHLVAGDIQGTNSARFVKDVGNSEYGSWGIEHTGGSLPYHPYYYGIYVWQRTTFNNQE